ncbi:hypothetical protein AVEN_270759-1, partial [Araneus ventricosus]
MSVWRRPLLSWNQEWRLSLPDRVARPAVLGDECNEIGLKFSPNYYLSTTVEYLIQQFSPTGYKFLTHTNIFPEDPSFGILKYGDPYFQSWSDSLVKVTILENNWLTSSKAKCASALDHIFGHCLHINNMDNDSQTLSDLASLSPFHMFCYTVIRRCLEIISLYLVRWLPLGSLFGLLSSSCALIWIYFTKRWKPMKEKAAAKGVSENFFLILLVFLCCTAVCLSFLVSFGLELVAGGIIDSQLAGFFKGLHSSIIEKVFYQNNSRSTVYDLFYFHCLRKTLFDLEKLEMQRSIPRNTEER